MTQAAGLDFTLIVEGVANPYLPKLGDGAPVGASVELDWSMNELFGWAGMQVGLLLNKAWGPLAHLGSPPCLSNG